MSENYEQNRIKDIRIKIDNEVGPTFCLAKWHHVTMYLQTGETHSCYHPRPHHIPLEELKTNPSAVLSLRNISKLAHVWAIKLSTDCFANFSEMAGTRNVTSLLFFTFSLY